MAKYKHIRYLLTTVLFVVAVFAVPLVQFFQPSLAKAEIANSDLPRTYFVFTGAQTVEHRYCLTDARSYTGVGQTTSVCVMNGTEGTDYRVQQTFTLNTTTSSLPGSMSLISDAQGTNGRFATLVLSGAPSDSANDYTSAIYNDGSTAEGQQVIANVQDPADIAARAGASNVGGDSTADLTGEGESSATDTTANCRGFALAWLLCGMINALADLGDTVIQQFIVPFLQSRPLNITDGNDPIFKVWSTFRVIANIILVAALIFVIFGNAIGDGFAQAYLAKRSLPRILIAAILINTSIYIAAAMVDITNILGRSIGQLMMAPFATSGAFLFNLGFGSTTALTLGMIGGAIFTVGVAGVIPFLLLFVLLPAVVAMLAVFVTLVLRQGIILFLVIISPVAFALFALPNTAKYFEKWWSMFLKTLLVYPIVMIVIAMSNILSVLVNEANPDAAGAKMIKDLVSIFLMLAPLFLIPFAFKMAGGITGQAFGAISGMGKKGVAAIKGNPKDPHSFGNRTKDKYKSGLTNRQQRAIAMGDKKGANWMQRRIGGLAGSGLFGNGEQRAADLAQRAAEYRGSLTNTGPDDLTYAAGGYEKDGKYYNSKGNQITKSLYKRGKKQHGYSRAAIADSLGYQLGKAQTDEDVGAFREAFKQNAIANNWNQDEIDDAWEKAAYPHRQRLGSEFYSAPKASRQGGKTSDVRYEDVSTNTKNMSRLIERAQVMPGYEGSALMDADIRAIGQHQSWVQGNLDTDAASGDGTANWNQNGAYTEAEAKSAGYSDVNKYAKDKSLQTYAKSVGVISSLADAQQTGGVSAASVGAVKAVHHNQQSSWLVSPTVTNGHTSEHQRDITRASDGLHAGTVSVTGNASRSSIPK